MEKIRKPRVLLTGFTPFGGETVNPALEAVKRVRCPEAELRILEVPTVFGDSARLVTAEMDAFRPDVVLCVGQAAGRSAVTPERVAINVDDARIPDNAGPAGRCTHRPWRTGSVFRHGADEGHGPGHPGGRGAVGAVQQRGDLCVQPPAVLRTAPCRSGSPGGVHPRSLHSGADGGHGPAAPGAAGDGPGGGGFGLL